MFQSTHPHGVRPLRGVSQKGWCCFNPRTHTGCDVRVERVSVEVGVSIHAPTRGATSKHSIFVNVKDEFQSTHPHGVRHHCITFGLYPMEVSIHAPTRGATIIVSFFEPSGNVSIHAPTRGATDASSVMLFEVVFQSTHPHGVRLHPPPQPKH